MKKIIFTALLSITFLFFPLVQYSSAVEMSVGASTWYCWWEALGGTDSMNLKPTLLYGPVASVRINDSWNVAGVFLYGQFSSKDTGSEGGPDTISRFDSDLSLNYNINRYFKIFGGGKFMGFTWDEGDSNGKHWSAGPGLGIGSTLPLISNLYLLINVSGTYSWGKHEDNNPRPESEGSYNLKEYTANTNASFAYYFASASTSLSLGFRYQYMYIDDNNPDDKFNFYGATFSAVYSF